MAPACSNLLNRNSIKKKQDLGVPTSAPANWCSPSLDDSWALGLAQMLGETKWWCASAGVLYAASLWLSNSAYLYLSVSFIQMTKSLMPGLVYGTGVFMGTEQFSKANAANMVLIAFGVLVCAMGELNLVFKGVAQQLAALLFEVRIFTWHVY